ncbi:oxidoreductase [Pilimelia anulata]|uniref:Oxidoreductase n=1 Tax=Pilimelia anulata TaxID=53371 RepID=A0A8J3B6E7_9ACTN|nr:oxidoreductase [Pilimelia anulata]
MLTVGALAAPAAAAPRDLEWKPSATGSEANLRGLAVVSDRIAWASGLGGAVLRTTDGGATWAAVGPPDTADLDFRDIEAVDENHALALSAGAGALSRIYRTTDGGKTWTETFRSAEDTAFYDCVTFFDTQRGLAVSDPVGGKFRLISTADGGKTWTTSDGPAAAEGEYAFAASGGCLVAPAGAPAGTAVFGSGGTASHYFRTTDHGATWTSAASDFPAAEYGGIFSLAFRGDRGIAVGGDARAAAGVSGGSAVSGDTGGTWALAGAQPADFKSAVAWVSDGRAVAVGPTGSDVTTDNGQSWSTFSASGFNSVGCAAAGACFAVGDKGVAATLAGTR